MRDFKQWPVIVVSLYGWQDAQIQRMCVCVWLSFFKLFLFVMCVCLSLLCVCVSLSVFQPLPLPLPPFCLYNGQCTINSLSFLSPPFPPTPHSSFIVVCAYFKENGFGISLCLLYQLEDCIISIFNTVLFYVLTTICHVHKFAFCDFISLMFKLHLCEPFLLLSQCNCSFFSLMLWSLKKKKNGLGIKCKNSI